MSDAESKHDKVLKRVHLWVAVLGGVVTLTIGVYNFKHLFFPDKTVSAPAAQVSAPPSKAAAGGSLSFEKVLPMDENGDGKVSEREWKGTHDDFYRLNLDGNSSLTSQDFQGTRFENMDRNADGQITRLEWRKARFTFDLLDADGDGKISADEFDARRKAAGA